MNDIVDKDRAVRDVTSTADGPTFTKLRDASFTSFQPCFMEEVRKLIFRSPPKSCSLDSLPTFILREFLAELLPFICIMCNVSLQQGLLPESQKAAIVAPILKKHDLDPDDVKSYRSVTWHSSPRSSNGSLPHSWRATFRWTAPSGPPISL